MKNKKTGIFRGIFVAMIVSMICGVFFISAPTAYAFSNPYSNMDDEGWQRFDSDHRGFVGGALNVAGDAVGDTLGALFGDLSGDSGDVTTFIGFKGGLQPPSKEGLDSTLTRTSSARDFVVKTVNFALSFLGLMAVVVVIYGGFLYVTSGGNEDQATKGKKAIQYAAIGIIIIIASFAFVNTIINFVGTDGTDTIKPGENTTVHGSATNSYNVGSVEVYRAALSLLDAYKHLVETERTINRIKQLPAPTTPSEHRSYISSVNSSITQIRTSSAPLSHTRIATQKVIDDYFITFQSFSDAKMLEYIGASGNLTGKRIKTETETKIDPSIFDAAKEDFEEEIKGLVGPIGANISSRPDSGETVEGTLLIVWKILGPIADANAENAIKNDVSNTAEIQKALAGIDPTATVGSMMKETIAEVDKLRGIKDAPQEKANIDTFIKTLKKLDQLYLVIRSIKFVDVQPTATITRGNAPLIVELSGLSSRDPAGTTIDDNEYVWDPDGDGIDRTPARGGEGFAAVDCGDDTTGATIHCIYNQPGTYYARLTIKSKDSAHVATGQNSVAIVVQPPIARIILTAKAGPNAEAEYLRNYAKDNRGNSYIQTDVTEYHVTTKEAQQIGVTFDATDSRGESDSQLQGYSWSFGDTTPIITGADKKTVTHKYKADGKYTLTLEVTDRNNRKDRKLVIIDISAIAARISATKTITEPEELVEFDGSISRSDNGQITSYEWQIINDAEGKDVLNLKNEIDVIGANDASVLRAKFKKPGSYTVHLMVNDGNSTATSEVHVSVKSRKPRANFILRSCPDSCVDPAQPSLVEMDATGSFDPDKEDELTYNWQIYNQIGEEVKDSSVMSIVTPNVKLPSKDTKKLRVKFNKVGKYKVVLTVNDSHGDTIRQEDRIEKEVTIGSIIEATWDAKMKPIARMVTGKAELTVAFKTTYADAVEVDFGDGETAELAAENCEGISEDKESSCKNDNATTTSYQFSHIYTQPREYLLQVTAKSDKDNGENIFSRRVYVTPDDNPFAIINVSIDGVPVILPESVIEGQTGSLEVIRKQLLRFDAGDSINSNGTTSGLKYIWNFGDGTEKTKKTIDYSFTDLTAENEPRLVRLTVYEDANPNKRSETTFPITVISKKPQATSLSIEKKTAGNVTPVEVQLTAEGAYDPDGKITGYQFWYFDPADAEHKLGVIDTTVNTALLRLDTIGEENEEHEYTFCVSLTDNDNSTTQCSELFNEEQLPKVTVKNGPNKAPTAKFEASRTAIRAGESVTLTSSGKDEDGAIVNYIWDMEGDGFQNDNPTTEASITHIYAKKSPQSGYRVKLKVIDDKGAEAVSREVSINVTAKSNDPEPNFTYEVLRDPPRRVQFYDSSKADTEHGAKIISWKWDFDTTEELGCDVDPKPKHCNGDKNDDVDSTDPNPRFDFPLSKRYQVKMMVEDSDGNVMNKTQFIDLIPGNTSASAPGLTPNAAILRAELTAKRSDGSTQEFETIPNCQISANDNCKKKVIYIPETSCGEDITYFWSDSRGDIINYSFDSNVFNDADGNGQRADDIENTNPTCTVVGTGTQSQNCFTKHYERADIKRHPPGTGDYRSRLLVTDRQNKQDEDLIDIYFKVPKDAATAAALTSKCEGGLFAASVFKDLGVRNTIIFSIAGGIGIVLMVIGVAGFMRRGKLRI
ncbi:PKD domain-containing protein [Candidatus Gracilibacteria bacterium]|nr:PKD domain-containing protein [Candidatus Gracilibacteria bacterium]